MSEAIKIYENRCLVHQNTLAIPAFSQAWAEASNLDDVRAAIQLANQNKWRLMPLGSGSNLVLGDRLPGLVLSINLRGIWVEDRPGGKVRVRCAAGENWHELVTYCVGRGFYGIENLALIPGTVGAAPIQNIGAYGVELSQVFHSLTAIDLQSGESRKFSCEDCQFSYRDSVFKQELRDRYLITEVTLELSQQASVCADYPSLASYLETHSLKASPENIYAAVCEVRRERLPHPADIPNAGSFFKNPVVSAVQAQKILQEFPDLPHWQQQDGRVKLSAAAMIESRGWKGKLKRGVGVHPNHALVLVNPGHESATTLLRFASDIQQSVNLAYGLALEIEPRCYPD